MTISTSSSVRKSIALESVARNVVKAVQGSHYVLKGAEGAFWDECLAQRSGDDLIVRFADGTVLVLYQRPYELTALAYSRSLIERTRS